ncbi:primase C-terminal domain-containing protein [Dellaglioa sp. BT-FLS60]
MNAKWFRTLINAKNVNAGLGLGRHNAIFTMALACFSSELSEEETFNLLDEFNSNLTAPIMVKEFTPIIKDAYSGKYKGASKVYIDELVNTWIEDHQLKQELKLNTNPRTLYKFKKTRQDRQNSHIEEGASDVLFFVNNQSRGELCINTTQRAIMEAVGIKSSDSLNKVLQYLKEHQEVYYKVTKGRYGKTVISTRAMLTKMIMGKRKEQVKEYIKGLAAILPEAAEVIREISKLNKTREIAVEERLFELDTG